MADDHEEYRPEEEEYKGGAVKSFLDHLEDLRWMLIKCCAAIAIAMFFCLFAVPQIMGILRWPLDRAGKMRPGKNQMVTVQMGEVTLGTYDFKTNQVNSLNFGSNVDVTLQLEPFLPTNKDLATLLGDKQLLSVRAVPRLQGPPANGPGIIFLDPSGPFIVSLLVVFYAGLIIASPFVIYFIGQFVMPALKIREKKYFLQAFVVGVMLFLTGVSFCYFILMPMALKVAEQYALWMGTRVPDWRAETYISFVCKFMFGMGLGFELPVVLLALVKIGVLNYKRLSAMRRYMIVINLILGAVLTTPEPITQIIMFVPLQLLYEASVWIAWYWEYRDRKKAQK